MALHHDWSAEDFVDLDAYMDGGTIDFRFVREDGTKLTIRLAQHMFLKAWFDIEPGRLYVNGELVPLNSSMEVSIKTLLTDIAKLNKVERIDRAIVVEACAFIGSTAYLSIAEKVAAMKSDGSPR